MILLLVLAGCVRQEVSEAPKARHVRYCPPAAKTPAPLPKIVDTQKLRVWADETEAARRATARALEECSRRLREATEY